MFIDKAFVMRTNQICHYILLDEYLLNEREYSNDLK